MNEISSRTETTAATQIVEADDGLGNIIAVSDVIDYAANPQKTDNIGNAINLNCDQKLRNF